MTKQLLLLKDVNESLYNGIVCYRIEESDVEEINEEDFIHIFLTRNNELIQKLTDGFTPDLNANEAYDIVNNKVIQLHTELFTGSVYAVATCYSPADNLALKDANLYLGTKNGAIVLSDNILDKYGEMSLEDFGIVGEEKFKIFKVCLGIEEDSLEDIYLVKGGI